MLKDCVEDVIATGKKEVAKELIADKQVPVFSVGIFGCYFLDRRKRNSRDLVVATVPRTRTPSSRLSAKWKMTTERVG